METRKILDKVKKEKTHTERFLLDDGGVVVDTTTDEHNRLHYVIKRDDEFTVELAELNIPIRNLIEHKPIRVRVANGIITKLDRG